ncbi:MAG: hypothetical protein IK152_03250 [Lachnospiraceae bacterium]|nr:hypothetical protein [Lachnospiraceae bacterium]
MNEATIEKPVLKESYVSAISCSQDDIEMMKRRQSRAKELGIRLFVLDGESNDQ